MIRALKTVLAGIVVCVFVGCSRYATPGGPADLSFFADPDVAEMMQRQPVATLPARLGIARVQASGYQYHNFFSYGGGRYSVALASDIETEEQLARIQTLPQVEAVVPLNSLLLPEQLDSEEALRVAAARLRADMVLIYTLDTRFTVSGTAEPLGVLTLGLLPNKTATVGTTASAIIVDTQTGFVYGAAQARSHTKQLANAWTSKEAIDQSRHRTELAAFEDLLAEVEKTWAAVVAEHTKVPQLPSR
jgi:hypothetical protein